MIAVRSLGRVWINPGQLYSLYVESWDQQDSCTVCRTSLDTRGIAVESLGRVGDQQDSCEVSRTSLGTIMIAVRLYEESGVQKGSCTVSTKSIGTSKIAVKSLGRVWIPTG